MTYYVFSEISRNGFKAGNGDFQNMAMQLYRDLWHVQAQIHKMNVKKIIENVISGSRDILKMNVRLFWKVLAALQMYLNSCEE